jgi:hypothetical protein
MPVPRLIIWLGDSPVATLPTKPRSSQLRLPSLILKAVYWRLKRIHAEALIEIVRCQPYQRSYPEADPLWLLEELDARDKHKLLAMTFFYPLGGGFHVRSADDVRDEITIHRNAHKDGAIIAEIQFPVGTAKSEVQVNAEFLSDVTFEEGIVAIGQRGILSHLEDIISRVKNIITGFDALIIANPVWIPS